MIHKMKGLLVIVAVVIVSALSLPALSVLAIDDPDTVPEVGAVYVYENCIEDGDIGVLVDYYLDYAVLPSETATEAYMAIFIDTDGTTQLQAVAPYSFVDSGYGRGLIWLYFSAAEVTAYTIDSDDELLYRVWLVGNPTLDWAGDPPKTVASIDYWQPDGASAATLVALRTLYYADVLELIWSLDLIEETALGSRLTATGEGYFTNVITNLRTIAPVAFSDYESDPELVDQNYQTVFGATMTDGTGTVTGSPITLVDGDNIVTVTGTGTFTFDLEHGTIGTMTDGTGTVTGSPVALVEGINTVTVTGNGTFTVAVSLDDTTTTMEDTVLGTGLDLTDAAEAFGMTRWFFSGIVWFFISIIICSAVYRVSDRGAGIQGSGKIIMIVFNICIVGGALLGLMHPVVATLLFIGFGALTGYILFFKTANI